LDNKSLQKAAGGLPLSENGQGTGRKGGGEMTIMVDNERSGRKYTVILPDRRRASHNLNEARRSGEKNSVINCWNFPPKLGAWVRVDRHKRLRAGIILHL